MRLLHGALVILVLWQISQFQSSRKWEKTLCLPKSSRLFVVGSKEALWEETGVRASVYWNFIIHQIFPEFLQPFRDLRIQRVARSIVVSFLFVFGILLAWVSSGCPDPSSTKLDTGAGEVSLTVASSRSRIWISLTVGEEDEDDPVS